MSSWNEEQYLDLLREHDDPDRAEAPTGFRRAVAESAFVAFAEALVTALGVACESETGARIQDASHHGVVRLPDSLLTEPYVCGVRVSNFGRFCCVYDDDEVVKPAVLEVIRQLAERHGYVFIPSSVLGRPYDGRNPGVSGFATWGHRFFDYI